jgi:hypothetical protein
MLWGIAADAVVVLHLAFIVFAALGAFLALHWRGVLWLHVPAFAWAAWIAATGSICPLTPLENELRRRGGEAGYEIGFIEHYILPLLYPVGLTRETQWVLGLLLLALNGIAYALLARRRRAMGGWRP